MRPHVALLLLHPMPNQLLPRLPILLRAMLNQLPAMHLQPMPVMLLRLPHPVLQRVLVHVHLRPNLPGVFRSSAEPVHFMSGSTDAGDQYPDLQLSAQYVYGGGLELSEM